MFPDLPPAAVNTRDCDWSFSKVDIGFPPPEHGAILKRTLNSSAKSWKFEFAFSSSAIKARLKKGNAKSQDQSRVSRKVLFSKCPSNGVRRRNNSKHVWQT